MNNPFEILNKRLSNIEEIVLDIKHLPKIEANPEIETPINIKDVSKLTGLSVPTLYGYVQRNELPFYKKGNRLKFFKTEIIEWIKEGDEKNSEHSSCEASRIRSQIIDGKPIGGTFQNNAEIRSLHSEYESINKRIDKMVEKLSNKEV